MVSRSIWDHPDFTPSEFSEREAFLWLVSEAAWKARRVRAGNVVVDLERGQLCASVRFMATAWMWSKSRVARFIKKLEKVGVVRSDVGTGQLVITLCNYDKFQVIKDSSGTAAGQHISKNDEMRSKSGTAQVDASPCNESEKQGERDSSGTAAGQQRDSSGTNYNKGNKGNNDNILPKGSVALPVETKPFDEIAEAVSAYNVAAEESGWPKVAVLSKARRAALAARMREAGGIAGWQAALAKAQASDMCCGQNQRGWVANFDFLTRQSSFAKLMEGNYDNRTPKHSADHTGGSGPHSGMVAAFAEVAARKSGRT